MSWFYVAVLVIAVVAAVVLAPKPPKQRPAALTEFDIPTAEEGRPIPVVFGTVLVQSSNVVWYGDLAYARVRSSGGK